MGGREGGGGDPFSDAQTVNLGGGGGHKEPGGFGKIFFLFLVEKRRLSSSVLSLPFLSGGRLVGREGEQQFSSSFPFLGVEERGFLWGSVSSVTGGGKALTEAAQLLTSFGRAWQDSRRGNHRTNKA